MRKFFFSALLALTASGFAAAPSFASTFGLFPHCGCCCCAKVCCRQYNAFSPFCCDCCCPCPVGGGCGAPPCGPGPAMCGDCGPCDNGMCGDGMCGDGMCPGGSCGPNFSGTPSCPSGGCADGSCLGSLPAAEPGAHAAPGGAAPPASNPVVGPSPMPGSMPAGPSPMPGSMPAGPTSQARNPQLIQNASYRPGAVPAPNYYTPTRMQPQTMAAPSYWGN